MAKERSLNRTSDRRGSSFPLVSFGLVAAVLAATVAAPPAAAQNSPAWQQPPPQQQPPAAAQPPRPPAKQQQKRPADAAPGAGSGTEAGLRQRVEQLEEQLVDLQVVVGTVESLSRGGGSPAATSTAYRGGAPMSGGTSGADAGRVAALETQVQALTSQLDQMAAQLRAIQGNAPRGPSGPAPRVGAGGGGFGQTTVVTPDDPIANIINGPGTQAAAPPTPPGAPGAPGQRFASAPQSGPSTPASRQAYDQAYTQLLQQNYAAAEAGFSDYLARFPSDELSPNAQFWLGETHFVRGQWDPAAAAFLKVAQSFPRAEKAPDSLAKFAMSMERKGNRPAACRALQELNTRYPSPPAHVRTWETAERRRAGCT